jgi:hypothetical protein
MSTDYERLAAQDVRQFSLWTREEGRLFKWQSHDEGAVLVMRAEQAWSQGVRCTLADPEGVVIWCDGKALIWHQAEVRPADLIALEEFRL